MKLKSLSLKDKKTIEAYLLRSQHRLSAYSFQNIYIWRRLFDIKWAEINGNLCVFFSDKTGCFMNLAPLGQDINKEAVLKAFEIMDRANNNKAVSRIENLEERHKDLFERFGFEVKPKYPEYLCMRDEMATLKGDRFKSKRAAANYFLKNYVFEFLDYCNGHADGCRKLYKKWMQERADKNIDPVYVGMMQDSLKSLEVLLADFSGLDSVGKVIVIDGRIKGFTFGFRLDQDSFCIAFEITDLSLKGISQFIFSRFCSDRDLERYKYINIMDDSGLTNLKQVKLSYRPVKTINSFIAARDHA